MNTSYKQTLLNLPVLEIREEESPLCTTPEQAADLLKDTRDLAQEVFSVITIDVKNRHIKTHAVTVGTLNTCIAHPRDVFRAAIADNAAALILGHNHPSGDPTPSAEDIKVTKQMIGAGEVMGIKVLDHIIIGRKGTQTDFISLRECGLVKFC